MRITDLGGGRRRLSVSGRWTFAIHREFRDAAERALADGPTGVELDLSGLQFIDSAGLSMVMILHDKAAAQNASLTVTNASDEIVKLFDIVDIGDWLEERTMAPAAKSA